MRLLQLVKITTLLLSASIYGQSLINNFAIGSLNQTGNVFDASIAYSGVAIVDSNTLSLSNPASWTKLKKVGFMGVFEGNTVIQSGDVDVINSDVAIKQFGFSFPVGKNIGVVLGVEPVSNFSGFLSSTTDEINYYQTQIGSIQRLYSGFGVSVGNISLGVKYGILSGFLGQRKLAAYSDENYRWDGLELEGNLEANDLSMGALWSINHKISLGASVSNPLQQITYTGDASFYNLSRTADNDGGFEKWALYQQDEIISDGESVDVVESVDALPTIINIGASIKLNSRLSVQISIDQKSFPNEVLEGQNLFLLPDGGKLISTSSIRLGMASSARDLLSFKFMDRVKYGIGFYYGNDYLSNDENEISNVSKVTGGLELPLAGNKSSISISGYLGSRENINDLPSEKLIGFSVGLSVREIWFVKTKRR